MSASTTHRSAHVLFNPCSMIQIKGIQKKYNDAMVLNFKDWSIADGEHWLMLGGSGSGKTTLLHMMTGLMKPTQGEVLIQGQPIYQLQDTALDRFRGQHIGIVFQRPHLIKSMTVYENLVLAQSLAGLPTDGARIEAVLASLDIERKKKNYPSELSQGQLQRVAIARAVVNHPALLIADEPTSSLDDKNTMAVLELLIQQAANNNSTLVIATHDQRVKDRLNKSYQVSA